VRRAAIAAGVIVTVDALFAVGAAAAVLFGPLAFALFESANVRWHDTLAGLVPVLAIVLARASVGRPAPSAG